MKKLLVLTVAAMLGLGCSSVSQRATTSNPDGTLKESVVKGRTVFQSAQTLEKARAQNGEVQQVGMSGLEQKSDAAAFATALGSVIKDMAGVFAAMQTGGIIRPSGGGTIVPTVPALVNAPDGVYTVPGLGTFTCIGGNCTRYVPATPTPTPTSVNIKPE